MRGALAMGRLWPEVEVEIGASKAARLLVVCRTLGCSLRFRAR